MAFWSLVKSSRWRPKRTTRSRFSRRKEKARDQSPPPSSATLPALRPYRSTRKRAAACRSTDSSLSIDTEFLRTGSRHLSAADPSRERLSESAFDHAARLDVLGIHVVIL